MPWDRRIDPVTRDYIRDGAGGWERTSTIETELYFQFAAELGAWWGGVELGGDIAELRFIGQIAGIEAEAQDRARRAVQPIIESGRAADPEIRAQSPRVGVLLIETSVVDVQTGERVRAPSLRFGV